MPTERIMVEVLVGFFAGTAITALALWRSFERILDEELNLQHRRSFILGRLQGQKDRKVLGE